MKDLYKMHSYCEAQWPFVVKVSTKKNNLAFYDFVK